MRRVLAWMGAALALWTVYVWMATQPRFWAGLALTSERVSYGARAAFNRTKQQESDRRTRIWEKINHQLRARPHTGDTITDIEDFLRHHRSP